MRIGIPRSRQASATILMCSGLRMLPGLRRRQCTPASSAARAILYWWWMSATTGTGQGVDLLERALDIGGLRGGHGLHRDRRVAADGHGADHQLTGLAPLEPHHGVIRRTTRG